MDKSAANLGHMRYDATSQAMSHPGMQCSELVPARGACSVYVQKMRLLGGGGREEKEASCRGWRRNEMIKQTTIANKNVL